jgi:S-formylglutathione hydrolase FrmB
MRTSRLKASLRAAVAVLGVASTLTLAPADPVDAAVNPPALPNPNSHGITVTGGALTHPWLMDDRLFDAEMTTAAIMEPRGVTTPTNVSLPVKVRFLLPAGYDPNRPEPYDVLYLLHGGGDTFSAWSDYLKGNLVNTLAGTGFNGIVVMPEAGHSGWYLDWAGKTDGNFAPQWETFHIDQLLPWVDDNFNTSGTRDGRAVAGLSMGGFGALRYAASHDDLFSAVGAFSPGTDIRLDWARERLSQSMVACGACVDYHGVDDGHFRVNRPSTYPGTEEQYRLEALLGPEVTWQYQNPVQKAEAGGYAAYSGRMAVYTGGLAPDAQGPGDTDIGLATQRFHEALGQLNHRYCGGSGSHNWDAWKQYLPDFIHYAYNNRPADYVCPTPPNN